MLLAFLLSYGLAAAQSQAPPPHQQPHQINAATVPDIKPVDPSAPAIPDANKVVLLKVQHESDDITAKQKDLQIQAQQLNEQFMSSPQMKQLQSQFEALNQQAQAIRAKLDSAKSEALRAAGADPQKFEVSQDLSGLTAKPAQPAKPPQQAQSVPPPPK